MFTTPKEADMHADAGDAQTTVRELSLPIHQSKGWLRLIGVLSIIQGALTALSVFGILIAWLPIWIGVVLLQAASSAERARVSGEKEIFYQSLAKLRTYFVIQGVLTLIMLIIAVGGFVVVVAMGLTGAMLEAMRG